MAQPEKKEKIRYDINLLITFCSENKIVLLKDYSGENINRDKIIEGKCIGNECENNFKKTFRQLYYIGGYCSVCSNTIRIKRGKITMITNYGVENPMKLKEIKEKSKKTCMKNYGVEYSLQSNNIREKSKKTCMKKFGVENPLQSQEVKEKSKKTCMKNYGVENPSQSQKVKEQKKATCLRNFGVEYSMQTEIVKNKSKLTNIKNYGVEHSLQSQEIKDKIKATNIEKFGFENPFQSKEIKDKIKATNIERYGFERSTQNAEIAEKASKNAYKAKDYIFPSGRIERIQGYEHFMFDELLQKENMSEDDIIVNKTEVPDIWYKDENGNNRRYFVDCYIPSQQRCIEVKSKWTAEKKKDCIFLKQNAVKEAGYECEIWIYNSKGEKIETYM